MNHVLIPRANDVNLMDYLDGGGVSIVNGTLHVRMGLWYAAGSWEASMYEYTFRWQRGRFELIGYDSERLMRNTGDITELSINYSTRRAIISRGNQETEVRPVGQPRVLPRRNAISLDGVRDGIAFDPGVSMD